MKLGINFLVMHLGSSNYLRCDFIVEFYVGAFYDGAFLFFIRAMLVVDNDIIICFTDRHDRHLNSWSEDSSIFCSNRKSLLQYDVLYSITNFKTSAAYYIFN